LSLRGEIIMAISNLVIVLTHTGLTKDDKPNNSSIFLPDIEVGYEYQSRKQAVYVPRYQPGTTDAGTLELTITNRVAFSMQSGAIKAFVEDGLLSCDTYVRTGSLLTQFGGGVVIIEDDGEISGTYNTSVLCIGDATIAGATTIKGDLIVQDDLYNGGGYELRVYGNLTADDLFFDPDEGLTQQESLYVYGNLTCEDFEFTQILNSNAEVVVNGDLIMDGELTAGGQDGADGLDIEVDGDCIVEYIYLDGGSSSVRNAGNGGGLTVGGDLISAQLSLDGGDFNGDEEIFNAGNGGDIQVDGDMVVSRNEDWDNEGDEDDGYVSCLGGDLDNGALGHAGDGGYIHVDGNITAYNIDLRGGDCDTESNNGYSGQGGDLYVGGNCTVADEIQVSGGDRNGLSNVVSDLPAPHAGDVYVYGNCTTRNFYGEGGDVNCFSNTIGSGGNGSEVDVYGTLTVHDEFSVTGGYCRLSNGGNGGDVDVRSSLQCDYLNSEGGNSETGNGGNGGTIDVDMNHSGSVDISGGSSNTGNGGRGGYIYVDGQAIASNMLSNGGSSNSGDGIGGNPGDMEFRGGLKCNSISMQDGSGDGVGTNAFTLRLSHDVTIKQLSMTNSVNAFIKPTESDTPINMIISSMSGKTRLNYYNGPQTVDISSYLNSSWFKHGAEGWYYLSGLSLVVV